MFGMGAVAIIRVEEGVGLVDSRSNEGVKATTAALGILLLAGAVEVVVGVRPVCSGSPRKEPALTPATCRAWNWCIHKLERGEGKELATIQQYLKH